MGGHDYFHIGTFCKARLYGPTVDRLSSLAVFRRMTKRPAKSSRTVAALPTDYAPLLAEIKSRVQSARIKAGLAANRELLALYWDIGRLILDRQRREGWGAKVIHRLSQDLQRELPGQQGFSRANLLFMRAFAAAWSETPIVLQPVRQLTEAPRLDSPIVQAPLALARTRCRNPSRAPCPPWRNWKEDWRNRSRALPGE